MNKKLLSVFVAIILVTNICIVYAGEFNQKKNETVYVNLDEYGNVEQINVYNEYILNKQEQIIDYGIYENIQNINTKLSPLQNENGGIIWNTSGLNRLAYIGKLSSSQSINIPWNIDLSYRLNGVECNPVDILNQKGVIGVTINVVPNKQAPAYYQNNYMLQITSDFDMSDYISVEAKDATEVITGMTKTLMFIALPGQEKTFDIVIGSDNFEMDGLTIAMIPLQGDIFEAIIDIVKDKKETEDAFDSLDNSLNIILNEMNSMTSGLTTMIEGTKTINSGTDNIYELSNDRNEAIQLLKDNLTQLSTLSDITVQDIDNFNKHVDNANKMLEDMSKTNEKLIENMSDVQDDLDEMAERLETLPKDLKEVKKLLSDSTDLLEATKSMLQAQMAGQNFDTTVLTSNLENITQKTTAIATTAQTNFEQAQANGDTATASIYQGILSQTQSIGASLRVVQTQLQTLQDTMDNGITAGSDMIDSINDIKGDLNDMITINNRLIDYSKDVPGYIYNLDEVLYNISTHIETLDMYTKLYLENKEDVTNSLNNIKEVIYQLQEIEKVNNRLIGNIQANLKIVDSEIYKGTDNLTNGMISMLNNTKNITRQANNIKTSKDNIKTIVQNRNDELENETTVFKIDPNAEVISFTSEQNTSPEKVQILLKSKDIKQATIDNIEDIESSVDNTSIWDRIINIFKTIWNSIMSIFG